MIPLNQLKKQIEAYKELIRSPSYGEIYKWIALKNFQTNWNLEAIDFKSMYNNSLKNKISNNLWANPHWYPKAMMLKFIDHDQERVRKMFINLFDESELIYDRIERFVFHCDNLLKELNVKSPSMKNHFHDGQRIISLYLAFKFPDKYAIYKFSEFKTFMEIINAPDIPSTGEYEKFFKVVRSIFNEMIKDSDLISIHKKLLTNECYLEPTLMLSQDLIFCAARRYM